MEYIPISLNRATQIYLALTYGYAAYKCANSWYGNARTVIKICHNTYVLSSHAKHKVAKWWYAPPIKPQVISKQVELMDIMPLQASSKINIPSSLDDAVVHWFTEGEDVTTQAEGKELETGQGKRERLGHSPGSTFLSTSSCTPQSMPESQALPQTKRPIE